MHKKSVQSNQLQSSDNIPPHSCNLLDLVIQQGQKLRNSILETILKNDPFFMDSNLQGKEQVIKMHTINMDELKDLSSLTTEDKHKFLAYLKGEQMTINEEKEVLNTFRALSTNELCDLTSRSFMETQNSCCCDICKAYNSQNFKLPFVPPLNLKSSDRIERIDLKSKECFKYVDSLKIYINSLKLNLDGRCKVSSTFNAKQKKIENNMQLQRMSTMFFVEYEIPQELKFKTKGGDSKVDSGLSYKNAVKVCSKRQNNNVVYFRTVSEHKIQNLECKNLSLISLKLKVSCRPLNERLNTTIGFANLNLNLFSRSSTLSCTTESLIFSNEESPLAVGSIKVSLKLGYKNLYYGKELMESLENNVLGIFNEESKDFHEKTFLDCTYLKLNESKTVRENVDSERATKFKKNEEKSKEKITDRRSSQRSPNLRSDKKIYKLSEIKIGKLSEIDLDKENVPKELETVLFGFIYVSEVEYLEKRQLTYFTCRPFCQNDFINSNISNGSHFNFYQLIPYIYDDEFLSKLRDNFMVLEFFEKREYRDHLIGICRIPLHQYYLAFRNPTIVKYLERNKLPVIGTDWFEPITHPSTHVLSGQIQVLVALGSEEQIQNLQRERGFKDDLVTKAKKITLQRPAIRENSINFSKSKSLTEATKKETVGKKTREIQIQTSPSLLKNSLYIFESPKNNQICLESKSKADKSTLKIETVDAASQSDAFPVIKSIESKNMNEKSVEALQNYLQQLSSRSSQSQDVSSGEVEIRTKEELLNTIQVAINKGPSPQSEDFFKVRITVESALHLPSRKKCKTRRVNGKLTREEVLPSTYVSFESRDAIKVSQVVQKTSSPLWSFTTDVYLTTDFLTNKNKRLIFKVWLKGNNGSTVQNMEIDSVLGFVAVDLSVLLAGLPTVDGWFNIMDYSGKCKGQIKISAMPLENIAKYKSICTTEPNVSTTHDQAKSTDDPPEVVLSRALKRKFSELDKITHRLRARLSEVTTLDSNCMQSDENDAFAEEFEKDINTLCIEDDYDTLDFTKEAHKVDMQLVSDKLQESLDIDNDQQKPAEERALQFIGSCCAKNKSSSTSDFASDMDFSQDSLASDLTAIDQQLLQGKEKIDTLLQKLTLIGGNCSEGEPFGHRYVSGCSVGQADDLSLGPVGNEKESSIERSANEILDSVFSSINLDLREKFGGGTRDAPDGANISNE